MKKNLLVIDHSAVVDLYRERERILSKEYNYNVSMIIPNHWNEGSRNVFLNKNDTFKIYNSKTLFTNSVPLFIYNPFTLIKAMINEKPDIIDIHEEPYSLAAIETILLKKIFSPKSKVVFYSAQNILKKYPLPIRIFEKVVCKNSDAAYTCSSEVTTVLEKRSFKKNIKEIPLGIDENIFYPIQSNKKNKFIIGFVGRVEYSKGILDLIEALKLIKEYNWECIIVGDGSLLNTLKSDISNCDLKERINLVGSISANYIAEYINKMDIVIVPSKTMDNWKEQFGRIIVEAFACGKPVIGSNSGAIPEVVASGGLIYKEGDIYELKEKLKYIIENPKIYKELSVKAIEESKKSTWSNIAKEFDIFYKSLLESGRRY